MAAILLGGVEARKPKDYLVSALAKIKVGDIELASQIIQEYSNIQWPRLQSEDMFIHYKLYELLEMHRNLTVDEQNRALELKTQLVNLEYTDLDSEEILDINSLCTLSDHK